MMKDQESFEKECGIETATATEESSMRQGTIADRRKNFV
jgi:hypothetical protein